MLVTVPSVYRSCEHFPDARPAPSAAAPGNENINIPEKSGESETVARCASLGRSQDVCKESRLSAEGERCVVSSRSIFQRLRFMNRTALRTWGREGGSLRGCPLHPCRSKHRLDVIQRTERIVVDNARAVQCMRDGLARFPMFS